MRHTWINYVKSHPKLISTKPTDRNQTYSTNRLSMPANEQYTQSITNSNKGRWNITKNQIIPMDNVIQTTENSLGKNRLLRF